MNSKTQDLGDRMKGYEMSEAGRAAMKGLPLLVRLDGISFHSFTRGLQRPYHEGLSKLMIDTTKHLVEKTHALIGYCQSDEISLAYFVEADGAQDFMHSGRFQKMTSKLAACATGFFVNNLRAYIPEKAGTLVEFDARA